ncbi:hypothetical protein A1D31_22365 [Bradyrhizobium liaoningense]|nr:hypothetical protein A1D31_22365 [Bradyrhizobium liaoningense]
MREERKGLSKASLRGLRTKQRMEVMRSAKASQGVRVVPANDDVRRLMKHPGSGGFPASGAATWPEDRFTKRRLADGSITAEDAEQPQTEQEQRNGRQQERREPERQRRSDEPNDAA